MKTIGFWSALKVALILFIVSFYSCSRKPRHDLLITNVNIVDVKSGEIHQHKYVGISGNRINSIYDEEISVPLKTRILDGDGKYLIPGLWDMHNHCYDKELLGLFVANGITGTRQMWGEPRHLIWREEIENHTILGPRLLVGSPIIDGPNSWEEGFILIDSISEISEIVSSIKENGYDFVKIVSFLPSDFFQAICNECKKRNLSIAGHVPYSVDPVVAARSGLRSHEHINLYLDKCSPKSEQYRNSMDSVLYTADSFSDIENFLARSTYEVYTGFDSLITDSLASIMFEFNNWICPTLIITRGTHYVDDQMFVGDERMQYLPKHKRAKGTADDLPQAIKDFLRQAYWNSVEILRIMTENGIPILAGTDVFFPGFGLHEELELLVNDAGLTPFQALQSATINAAEFMEEQDNLGTVEVGKLADLVLLDANPLDNIENSQKIYSVIVDGILLDESKLDSIFSAYKQIGMKEPISDTILTIIDKQNINSAITFYNDIRNNADSIFYFNYDQLNTVGYSLLEKQMYSEAIDIFKLNIEEYPDVYWIYDSLAEAYEKSGQKEKAIEYYSKTLELNPLYIHAKKKIAELKNTTQNESV